MTDTHCGTATHMPSPVGPIPIRQTVREQMAHMTDRQIADAAIGGQNINPEMYAELCRRGLSGPGVMAAETYRAIAEREAHQEMQAMSHDCGMGTVPGHWRGLRDWLVTQGIHGRLPPEQRHAIAQLCEGRARVQEIERDGPG